MVKGYHQVPVCASDIPKTAVATLFGCFEYLRMPLGLKNTMQTFQCVIDSVLVVLDRVFVYLGNILVVSRGDWEHKADL